MDVDNPHPRRLRGITLVELVTTLAVLAVSLAVIVPSWASLTERSRVTTAANSLLAQLRYARNEAVTRNRSITLCPSDDASTCSADPFGWQRGYIVFADDDGNRDRAAGESLLRVIGGQPPGMHVHSTAGRPAIRFKSDGSSWTSNTTLSVCFGDDARHNRAVILYGTGRARVDRVTADNRPVSCT